MQHQSDRFSQLSADIYELEPPSVKHKPWDQGNSKVLTGTFNLQVAPCRDVLRKPVFNSIDDFKDQPKIINPASEILSNVLGEKGKHARAAVSVNALPLGASVEIEALFEI